MRDRTDLPLFVCCKYDNIQTAQIGECGSYKGMSLLRASGRLSGTVKRLGITAQSVLCLLSSCAIAWQKVPPVIARAFNPAFTSSGFDFIY